MKVAILVMGVLLAAGWQRVAADLPAPDPAGLWAFSNAKTGSQESFVLTREELERILEEGRKVNQAEYRKKEDAVITQLLKPPPGVQIVDFKRHFACRGSVVDGKDAEYAWVLTPPAPLTLTGEGNRSVYFIFDSETAAGRKFKSLLGE